MMIMNNFLDKICGKLLYECKRIKYVALQDKYLIVLLPRNLDYCIE